MKLGVAGALAIVALAAACSPTPPPPPPPIDRGDLCDRAGDRLAWACSAHDCARACKTAVSPAGTPYAIACHNAEKHGLPFKGASCFASAESCPDVEECPR